MMRTRSFAVAAALSTVVLAASLIAVHKVQAQASERVFELRTYTCNEGKLPDLMKRFRDHTITIFNRHHMTSIGYWVPQDAPRSGNTLIYILAHPSRDAAKANWAAFNSDPEWQKVRADSEANGKLVSHVDSVYMTPADFSEMK